MARKARTHSTRPSRIHLLGHANPLTKDIRRFGFADSGAYLEFIRAELPRGVRLTANARIFEAELDQQRAGRRDDAARVRDLQSALDDPNTLAIVAGNGGGYLSRIIPELDFAPLTKRKAPLWLTGFSELTTLVNIVASYRCGRGLYWLCPNYLAWKIRPAAVARAALAAFWRAAPRVFRGERDREDERDRVDQRKIPLGPIAARHMSGKLEGDRVRVFGGCLSVLAAMVGSPLARRIKPAGKWLLIEDIKEEPYRTDRHLAALKLAGWLDQLAGVIIGDFHMDGRDGRDAVLELLPFHLPRGRKTPILTTDQIGHCWPMLPLPINAPLRLIRTGRGGRSYTLNSPTPLA